MTRSTSSSQTIPDSRLEGPAALGALWAQLGAGPRTQAVSHRSWARNRVESYERFELLGDSVLQLVVTRELMDRFPDAHEGDLAWMRQAVVNRNRCAEAARAARLHEAMRERAPAAARDTAGPLSQSTNVQAALAEAVIGAAWLDCGPQITEVGVLAAFGPFLDRVRPGVRDPKTTLQERLAQDGATVSYRLDQEVGPAHARVFRSSAVVAGRHYGSGEGNSKQASEQAAAQAALARIEAEGG